MSPSRILNQRWCVRALNFHLLFPKYFVISYILIPASGFIGALWRSIEALLPDLTIPSPKLFKHWLHLSSHFCTSDRLGTPSRDPLFENLLTLCLHNLSLLQEPLLAR